IRYICMLLLFTTVLNCSCLVISHFCFTDPATTRIYPLSLHDALPISSTTPDFALLTARVTSTFGWMRPTSSSMLSAKVLVTRARSEEHTSELQSRFDLVCRLLLEKKKEYNNSKCL